MICFEHLNEETNTIINRINTIHSVGKRKRMQLYWLTKVPHFVYHHNAVKCIDQCKYIIDQTEDLPHDADFESVFNGIYENTSEELRDLEGMTITGESGTGKTSIILEFIRLQKRRSNPNFEHHPVTHIFLKDAITGLMGLYSALLAPYNSLYANPKVRKRERISVDILEQSLIYTLKTTGTRLIFIDEFQHALGRNRQAVLNQLKRTMVVSQVPFIIVGTPDIEYILNSDPQLADRCPVKEYSRLKYSFYDDDFKEFVGCYEEFLPFPEQSGLNDDSIAEKIFEKIKFGNPKHPDDTKDDKPTKPRPPNATSLRRLVNYINKVATVAIRKNHNKITRAFVLETPP